MIAAPITYQAPTTCQVKARQTWVCQVQLDSFRSVQIRITWSKGLPKATITGAVA